jgi:hypothetical protein
MRAVENEPVDEAAPSLRAFRKGGNPYCVQMRVLILSGRFRGVCVDQDFRIRQVSATL